MVHDKNSTRPYFLSNCCHTCKIPGPKLSCDICRMVFYCSEEHRKQTWQEHSHLCRAIYKVLNKKSVEWLYQEAAEGTAEKFRNLRHDTAMECVAVLGRSLLPFEIEILYWPKVCNNCYIIIISVSCIVQIWDVEM